MNMLDLYYAREYELAVFGEHWCMEGRPEHAIEVLCAVFEAPDDGDGLTCRVYREAWPAIFYRIELEGDDDGEDPRLAANLTTGSGMHDLTAAMAKAISQGMLSVRGRPEVTR